MAMPLLLPSAWCETLLLSANMADNNNDDDLRHRKEAQEQTSRAQQEALDNIQHILT